jgi:hypothetical protein
MKATPRPDTDARQRLCHGEDGVRTRLGASARRCVISSIALPLLVSACVELPGQPPDAGTPDASTTDASPPDARGDGVPPRVIASTPSPDEGYVDPGVYITVYFDEDIDPSTVHEASFTVVDRHGRPVLGDIRVEGTAVQFAPTIDLTFRDQYAVTLTTEVTDLAGTPLAEPWHASFYLRDGTFREATFLDSGNVSGAVAAIGDLADGFVLWRRDAQLSATHHTPYAGWGGTPVQLTWGGHPEDIHVAAGHATEQASSDRALAAWRDDSGVRATRYAPPVGWERETVLLSASGSEPRVAMDARGEGMAVWLQDHGSHVGVFARRFRGPGWGPPRRIDSEPADARSLELAMDHAGRGVALWIQAESLWSAAFRDGRWEPAALFEQDAGPARAPRLVLDGDGRGMAFWIQHDGTEYQLRWSRLDPQHGWSPPAFVDGGPAVNPVSGQWQTELAFNSRGDAVAAWHEQTEDCNPASPVPDPCALVFARRFDLDHGWQEVEVVSEKHYETLVASLVATIDRQGTIWVAWGLTAPELGNPGIWLRRYTPGQDWHEAEPIATSPAGSYNDIAMVASPQGRMLVTWYESRDSGELFGKAFY